MTRCRLDVDHEGWTVRPRTRQPRKEPTMTSQPDTEYFDYDGQNFVVRHGRIAFAIESEDAVWLIADPPEGQPGVRLLVDLGGATHAPEFSRDLTRAAHSLTDQEDTPMTPTSPALHIQVGDVIVTHVTAVDSVSVADASDHAQVYSPDDEVTILPRPLSTIADLEATPYGTIVLDAVGEPWLHESGWDRHWWYRFGSERPYMTSHVALPATVLWTPEDQS